MSSNPVQLHLPAGTDGAPEYGQDAARTGFQANAEASPEVPQYVYVYRRPTAAAEPSAAAPDHVPRLSRLEVVQWQAQRAVNQAAYHLRNAIDPPETTREGTPWVQETWVQETIGTRGVPELRSQLQRVERMSEYGARRLLREAAAEPVGKERLRQWRSNQWTEDRQGTDGHHLPENRFGVATVYAGMNLHRNYAAIQGTEVVGYVERPAEFPGDKRLKFFRNAPPLSNPNPQQSGAFKRLTHRETSEPVRQRYAAALNIGLTVHREPPTLPPDVRKALSKRPHFVLPKQVEENHLISPEMECDLHDAIRGTRANAEHGTPERKPQSFPATAFKGVVRDLARLHKQGIIHGDIKPQNMLVKQGKVHLTDFDSAARQSELTGIGPTEVWLNAEALAIAAQSTKPLLGDMPELVDHFKEYGRLQDNCAMLLTMLEAAGITLPTFKSRLKRAHWVLIDHWTTMNVKQEYHDDVRLLIESPRRLSEKYPEGPPHLFDMLLLSSDVREPTWLLGGWLAEQASLNADPFLTNEYGVAPVADPEGRLAGYVKLYERDGQEKRIHMRNPPSLSSEDLAISPAGGVKKVTHEEQDEQVIDRYGRGYLGLTATNPDEDPDYWRQNVEGYRQIHDFLMQLPHCVEQHEVSRGKYLSKAKECDLWDMVKNRRNVPPSAFRGVLQDLAAMHKHQIVHGDIKLANILMDNGTAYMTDFDATQFMPVIRDCSLDPNFLSRLGYEAFEKSFADPGDPAIIDYLRKYGVVEDNCAMLLAMIRASGVELPDGPTAKYNDADNMIIFHWIRRHVKRQYWNDALNLITNPRLLLARYRNGVPELKDMLILQAGA